MHLLPVRTGSACRAHSGAVQALTALCEIARQLSASHLPHNLNGKQRAAAQHAATWAPHTRPLHLEDMQCQLQRARAHAKRVAVPHTLFQPCMPCQCTAPCSTLASSKLRLQQDHTAVA